MSFLNGALGATASKSRSEFWNSSLEDVKSLSHPLESKGKGENSQATGWDRGYDLSPLLCREQDRGKAAGGTLIHGNIHAGNRKLIPTSPLPKIGASDAKTSETVAGTTKR